MKGLTIKERHVPNDAACFVANRMEIPGVPEVRYDAGTDQMQAYPRPLDGAGDDKSVLIS